MEIPQGIADKSKREAEEKPNTSEKDNIKESEKPMSCYRLQQNKTHEFMG